MAEAAVVVAVVGQVAGEDLRAAPAATAPVLLLGTAVTPTPTQRLGMGAGRR